jgi:prohibitin 1
MSILDDVPGIRRILDSCKRTRPVPETQSGAGGIGRVMAMAFLFAVVIMFLWMMCIAVIPAGNIGVKDTFGVVDKEVYQSGIYLKSPFTSVKMMSIRTQKYMDYGKDDTAKITALSNDGLQTTMEIAVNYHLSAPKAADMYKSVGENYPDVVMVNPIHAVPRDLISKYDTKTLYSASSTGSSDRAKLETELFNGIQTGIDKMGVPNSVVIEEVSIRNIDFPLVYKTAIESKMKMDTEIQQKELEVKKQDMESNRMRSEAQGIADSNQIIKASLSDKYLEWYWIESMKNNPKTIYIPVGNNGLPMFKDVDSASGNGTTGSV